MTGEVRKQLTAVRDVLDGLTEAVAQLRLKVYDDDTDGSDLGLELETEYTLLLDCSEFLENAYWKLDDSLNFEGRSL